MKTCKDAAKEKRPLPVGVSDYVRALGRILLCG